ncbi:bile salt-activated lipase-like [Achroia grisella]|uniref:bile salt-activated lipase-like n=1 Tax=Achroia grisella TaxID=688607 RepID=UPI0027D2C9F4|nr:bile salt-activated lipase-like [Achroia grisella]
MAVRRELCAVSRAEWCAPPPADELWLSIPLRGRADMSVAAASTRSSSVVSYLHIACTYIPHGPQHESLIASFYDRAPQPADELSDGLSLADYTKHCLQPSAQGPNTGIEDCLELNIFAKNNIASQPVIVWLEGEEYLSTKMKTTFRRLVKKNTVVVSLNYRVSIFGFLCLGVPEAPGNAGLKDVILGLQWIKENIIQFGGDPNNVMLLRHGSGAAMVDLITMSPLSKDLVHKAFVISGSALAPWAISYDPIGYANIVGEKLAYSGKTPRKLAEELKSIDIDVLLYALNIEFTNNTVLFAPCVENVKLQDPFLHDTPINILKNGSFNHIPYVAAFADREGTLRANEYSDWLTKMESNFISFIPGDLEFGSEMEKTIAGNSIREFYFNNNTSINIKEYLNYHGDTSIIVPLIRGVKARAKTSKANVYLLEFAYRGSTNDDWPYPDIPVNGVKHGGILEYLFDRNMTRHGENAKTTLINYITSFARTGIPSSNAVSEQKWLPIQTQSFNYLHFGGVHGNPHTEVLQLDPHAETVTFWNDLYNNFHKIPNGDSSVSTIETIVNLQFLIILLLTLVLVMFVISVLITIWTKYHERRQLPRRKMDR